MSREKIHAALDTMGKLPTNVFGSQHDASRAYVVMRDAREEVAAMDAEISRLRTALKPFAKFAETYGPIARRLDFPESHILLQVGTAGSESKAVVVRLSDFYAAAEALGEGT